MDVLGTITLSGYAELVALVRDTHSFFFFHLPNPPKAFDDERQIFAVGSRHGVTFVDPRSATPVSVLSADVPEWSVRSLSFKHNLLTAGGGSGLLLFFDSRMQAPIPVSDAQLGIHTGKGWVQKDSAYFDQVRRSGSTLFPNAAYAHAWDASGSRLFVAGGPLLQGLYGSYAAVWS